jgi:hypothetical protein
LVVRRGLVRLLTRKGKLPKSKRPPTNFWPTSKRPSANARRLCWRKYSIKIMSLQLVGETLSTEKIGAATATVSFYDKTGFPKVPGNHRGLRLSRRETKQTEEGGYITTAIYEGRSADAKEERGRDGGDGGGGSGGTEGSDGKVYEWSPTFEQTDIAKHPRISELIRKYSGEQDASGNVVFPPKLSSSDKGTGLRTSASSQEVTVVNPMYGVTDFLSLGGIWSETELRRNLPNDVFNSIGQIAFAVPGGLPTPKSRFWLTMPPVVVEHGDQWKVTRRWMLSGIASNREVQMAQEIYGGIVE